MIHLSRRLFMGAGLLVMLSFACGGGGVAQPSIPPDVHVAGYAFNGTANVAMVWKNGSPVALTDGTRDAKGFAIFVSGGDVYVAGGQSSSSGLDVATYWKNGVPTALTDGTTNSMAESIVISGGDVYVAGYEGAASGGDIVTYWKNGIAVPLTDGSSGGEASSIAVAGNDVYVAGWTYETIEVAPNFFKTGPVAKVWKNGVSSWLSDGVTMTSVAESIVISGQDVFIAGYGAPFSGRPGGTPYIAQYWKNGTAVPLTDGTFGAKAFSLALSGGAVYAAGFSSAGAGIMATVWKNGTPTKWTNGSTTALILSLAVSGTDIYGAGFDGNTATVWHNGVPKALTDGRFDAEAYAVQVVPR